MPSPLRTGAASGSGDLPEKIFEHSLRGTAQPDLPHLRSSDEPTMERLPQRLSQKNTFNGIGFDQIKDGSKGPCILEALRRLNVLIGQVGGMQHQDAGN